MFKRCMPDASGRNHKDREQTKETAH